MCFFSFVEDSTELCQCLPLSLREKYPGKNNRKHQHTAVDDEDAMDANVLNQGGDCLDEAEDCDASKWRDEEGL